jgi:cytoskeletal protein CcmA (bactofilin family)
MWKWKEEEKPAAPASPALGIPPAPMPAAAPVVAPKEVRPVETRAQDINRPEVANIGKNVIIKGELSGSEDLYLDGEVEGNIELRGHSLTIGPNGRVRANIHAREITVHGKVDGNVNGSDRVELKKSAILVGDIFTQRISIEDGAYFKGGIDITKDEKPKETPRVEEKRDQKSVSAATAAVAGVPAQASLIEKK